MSDLDAPPTDRLRRLLLDVPNRRRIYEAITHHPGIHLRGLSRRLGLAIGSTEHHLHQLEKHGLVFSHRAGRRRSYFCSDRIERADAVWWHALARPMCADILAALALGDVCSVAGVAARLGLRASIVSHHLRRLRDEGLLSHCRIGRESVYEVNDIPRLLRVIRSHGRIGFQDGMADVVERALAIDPRTATDPVAEPDPSMIVPMTR